VPHVFPFRHLGPADRTRPDRLQQARSCRALRQQRANHGRSPRVHGTGCTYKHALEGFTGAKGQMPARGANAALKDDEVKAAVDYMVSLSR
jgi:cytochrome c5